MFDQTFVHREGSGVKPWTLLVSLLGQSSLIGAALLLPLIYTHAIPLHDLTSSILLVAPPPPAPAPEQSSPQPTRRPPSRFETILQAPREVPREIAIVYKGAAVHGTTLSGISGGIPGGVIGGILDLSTAHAMNVPPPAPIRVGGNVQAAKLINRVLPVYPAEAAEEDISGIVRLEATVTKEGTIRGLKVLEGHPLLVEAATEAVRQWRYRPTRLNGLPVEVITYIVINFKPSPPPVQESQSTRPRKRKQVATSRSPFQRVGT